MFKNVSCFKDKVMILKQIKKEKKEKKERKKERKNTL